MNVWNRTCFMIDTLERGGAQNQLLLIARYLQEEGLPPFHLIVFREPLTLLDAFKESGTNVILIKKQREIDLFFLFNLKYCLKKLKPLIIVSFLITSDMWGRLAAHMAGVPKIGSSVRNLPLDMGFLKDMFLLVMDKFSDFIVCNSRLAAEVTINRSGLEKSKVMVVYNGIAFAESSKTRNKHNAEIVIGMVARLVPQKDVSTLLKAFAIIDAAFNIKLVLVGDGPLRQALEEESNLLGIANKVLFMGERPDAKELIKGFDICILSSIYEGLSNSIMEYMQAGKPVIATKVGGNPELVEEGVTGYLVESGDYKELAEKIVALLLAPDKRHRMGQEGHKKITENFSVQKMVNSWDYILQTMT